MAIWLCHQMAALPSWKMLYKFPCITLFYSLLECLYSHNQQPNTKKCANGVINRSFNIVLSTTLWRWSQKKKQHQQGLQSSFQNGVNCCFWKERTNLLPLFATGFILTKKSKHKLPPFKAPKDEPIAVAGRIPKIGSLS